MSAYYTRCHWKCGTEQNRNTCLPSKNLVLVEIWQKSNANTNSLTVLLGILKPRAIFSALARLSPKGIWQSPQTCLAHRKRRLLLAANIQRPELLLCTLQCTGQPLSKNPAVKHINNVKVEKSYSRITSFFRQRYE